MLGLRLAFAASIVAFGVAGCGRTPLLVALDGGAAPDAPTAAPIDAAVPAQCQVTLALGSRPPERYGCQVTLIDNYGLDALATLGPVEVFKAELFVRGGAGLTVGMQPVAGFESATPSTGRTYGGGLVGSPVLEVDALNVVVWLVHGRFHTSLAPVDPSGGPDPLDVSLVF